MPAVGVLTGGGEAWRSGGVGGHGGRGWSRKKTASPATNHSGEGVIGFLGSWIGGGVAIGWRGRSWRGTGPRLSGGVVLAAGILELPRG